MISKTIQHYTLPAEFNVGDEFEIKSNGDFFIISEQHHSEDKIIKNKIDQNTNT